MTVVDSVCTPFGRHTVDNTNITALLCSMGTSKVLSCLSSAAMLTKTVIGWFKSGLFMNLLALAAGIDLSGQPIPAESWNPVRVETAWRVTYLLRLIRE